MSLRTIGRSHRVNGAGLSVLTHEGWRGCARNQIPNSMVEYGISPSVSSHRWGQGNALGSATTLVNVTGEDAWPGGRGTSLRWTLLARTTTINPGYPRLWSPSTAKSDWQIGDLITVSAWVKGTPDAWFTVNSVQGTSFTGGEASFQGTGDWQYVSFSYARNAWANLSAAVGFKFGNGIYANLAVGSSIIVGAVQLEAGGTVSPFAPGPLLL